MNENPIRQVDPVTKPKKPRMVLRVGFAGKQNLIPDLDPEGKPYSEEEKSALLDKMEGRLAEVLSFLGDQLVELAPHTDCQQGTPPAISTFYRDESPLLRLTTGLCDGGDAMAYRCLEKLDVDCLETENAVVLGFGLEDYRKSRDADFLEEFDREKAGAAYVLEGDGLMDERRPEGKKRRNRGYRLQSDLLLRQSDLMIVMVDPDGDGTAGGSVETIRKAMEFQLPVVLIRPTGKGIQVIEKNSNLADQLEMLEEEDWDQQLRESVTEIVANPDLSYNTFRAGSAVHGRELLQEFFSGGLPKKSDSLVKWSWFVSKFKTRGEKQIESDEREERRRQQKEKGEREPTYEGRHFYEDYRDRAAKLSRIYAEKYRNAFFTNAIFAVSAVMLASISLLLLSQHLAHPSTGLIILLLLMAAGKLILVMAIFVTSHRANHEHWNDRAVDYRYLAERLRAMLFLPEARIWQPPAAAPPQYASRVVRQSAVDWLHDAIVRAGSPGAWADEKGVIKAPPVADLAEKIKTDWIEDQEKFHRRDSVYLSRMSRWLELGGMLLNLLVMLIVIGDIGLIIAKACDYLHPSFKPWTPWIVLVTALIPAAVASVNLLRFQSECQRLAERSAVLTKILGGRRDLREEERGDNDGHHGPTDSWGKVAHFFTELWTNLWLFIDWNDEWWPPETPKGEGELKGGQIQKAAKLEAFLESDQDGAHMGRVMHYTEGCAEIFVQEVAEWSVLYAKEFVEA